MPSSDVHGKQAISLARWRLERPWGPGQRTPSYGPVGPADRSAAPLPCGFFRSIDEKRKEKKRRRRRRPLSESHLAGPTLTAPAEWWSLLVCVTESRAEIRGWTASGRRVSAGGAGHPPPLLSLARVAFAFAVRSASLESNPLCLAWRGAASGAEEAAEARSTASSLTSPHARPGAGGENFPVFDTAPTRPEISRSYPGDRRGTDQLGRRQGRAGPVHRHTHWQFFFLSPVVA
jgi:hypothetical protein